MNLLNLAKKSAKEIFKLIRKDGVFFCEALNTEVKITKRFLQHILYSDYKDRSAQEIMERILIMPFVPKILKKGVFIEKRITSERDFFEVYLEHQNFFLSIIIEYDKKKDRTILLSCFKKQKKKPVSGCRTPHHMR